MPSASEPSSPRKAPWHPNVDGLLKIKDLEAGVYSANDVRQYLENATVMLADACREGMATQSVFLLAYEGLHCLAMANLVHHEVRFRGQGHRTQALGLLVPCLDLEALVPGAGKAIEQAHANRNTRTYERPFPPVSAAITKAVLKVLEAALPHARSLWLPDQAGA